MCTGQSQHWWLISPVSSFQNRNTRPSRIRLRMNKIIDSIDCQVVQLHMIRCFLQPFRRLHDVIRDMSATERAIRASRVSLFSFSVSENWKKHVDIEMREHKEQSERNEEKKREPKRQQKKRKKRRKKRSLVMDERKKKDEEIRPGPAKNYFLSFSLLSLFSPYW